MNIEIGMTVNEFRQQFNCHSVDLDYQARFPVKALCCEYTTSSISDEEVKRVSDEWSSQFVGSLDTVNIVSSLSYGLEQRLEKISLKDGDLLVLKTNEPWKISEINNFKANIESLGYNNNLVVLGPEDSLSSMDEEKMGTLGWVKKRENRGREFI